SQITESQLQWMYADALGFPQSRLCFLIIHVLFTQLRLAEHARLIAENVIHHPAFIAQKINFLVTMRRVKMSSCLRIAIELRYQRLPVFETGANFSIQPF